MAYIIIGAGAIAVVTMLALYCSLAFREDGDKEKRP